MGSLQNTTDEVLRLAAEHFKVPRDQLTPDDDFFKKIGNVNYETELRRRQPGALRNDVKGRVEQRRFEMLLDDLKKQAKPQYDEEYFGGKPATTQPSTTQPTAQK